jgi:hypothetical protein
MKPGHQGLASFFCSVIFGALYGEGVSRREKHPFPSKFPRSIIFAVYLRAQLDEVSVRLRLFLYLFVFALPCLAQQNGQLPTPPATHEITPPGDDDEARARLAHEMEKKANKERVAALKNDTDKLLRLSIELKAYVDKSDENVLSLEVLKKAAEIEKLARSVKDKMKGPN